MSRIRHTQLPTLSSAAVVEAMRNADYGTNHVLVRFIDRNPATLERVLTSGTDRTDASCVFTQAAHYCVGNDASPAARAAAGITPGRSTYAFRLNLGEALPTIRWGGHTAGFPQMSRPLATLLEGLSATETVMLVYSPSILKRAPDAEAEYWFEGSPTDALLHVFSATGQDQRGPPIYGGGTNAA